MTNGICKDHRGRKEYNFSLQPRLVVFMSLTHNFWQNNYIALASSINMYLSHAMEENVKNLEDQIKEMKCM